MDIETYLLGIAGFALTAMGLSAIIASISLEQLTDRRKSALTELPIFQGIWGTIVNFFSIFILSVLPLLVSYALTEISNLSSPTLSWKISSWVLSVYLTIGFIMMARYNIKSIKNKQRKTDVILLRVSTWVFICVLPVVAGAIWNTFTGYGSVYLIILTFLFVLVLIWVGFVLWYAQENAKQHRAN